MTHFFPKFAESLQAQKLPAAAQCEGFVGVEVQIGSNNKKNKGSVCVSVFFSFEFKKKGASWRAQTH